MTTAADRSPSEAAPPAPRSGIQVVRRLLRMGFVRFVLVGGISAGVDAGLLWLLHGGFGVWLPAATFTGVVSSFGVNFLLNRGWTFGSGAPAGAQLLRYLLLAGTNWLVTVLAVTGLVALGLHYLVARFLVLGVMTVVNFLSYRAWVFRDPR